MAAEKLLKKLFLLKEVKDYHNCSYSVLPRYYNRASKGGGNPTLPMNNRAINIFVFLLNFIKFFSFSSASHF